MFTGVAASWAESIGVLQVRIYWTSEKLFNRVFWLEIPTGGVFPNKWSWEQSFGDFVEIF
jgi:hypothetical protein